MKTFDMILYLASIATLWLSAVAAQLGNGATAWTALAAVAYTYLAWRLVALILSLREPKL